MTKINRTKARQEIAKGTCGKEMLSSIPDLQQELVELVQLRGKAFQQYYALKSELTTLKLRFERAELKFNNAKQAEQECISLLTDSICVQDSPRAEKLRKEGIID